MHARNILYTLAYRKDPATMIGEATIYICWLQQDLPFDSVHDTYLFNMRHS